MMPKAAVMLALLGGLVSGRRLNICGLFWHAVFSLADAEVAPDSRWRSRPSGNRKMYCCRHLWLRVEPALICMAHLQDEKFADACQ